jgi:hypothetical protein
MFDDFIAATQSREDHYRDRLSDDSEEDSELPPQSIFPVEQLVRDHGANDVGQLIRLTWEEFQELFSLVKTSLTQSGRGRPRKLESIDQFFLFLLYVTSSSTLTRLAAGLSLSVSLVERTIYTVLEAIEE